MEGADGLCSRYSRCPIGDMTEVRIVFEGLDVEKIMGVVFFLDGFSTLGNGGE